MKPLDLNMSVSDATQKYPELIDIIAGLGFPQIKNKFLRNTMGKKYSLKQAIDKISLRMDKVQCILNDNGFTIVNERNG